MRTRHRPRLWPAKIEAQGRCGAGCTLCSREDALAEFSALSGFADVLASLERKPAAQSATGNAGLRPCVGAATGGLRSQLAQRDEVAEAVLDMEWLQRLNSHDAAEPAPGHGDWRSASGFRGWC